MLKVAPEPTPEELEQFLLDGLDLLKGRDKEILCHIVEQSEVLGDRIEDLEDEKQELLDLLADLVEAIESEGSIARDFNLKTLVTRAEEALRPKQTEEKTHVRDG